MSATFADKPWRKQRSRDNLRFEARSHKPANSISDIQAATLDRGDASNLTEKRRLISLALAKNNKLAAAISA